MTTTPTPPTTGAQPLSWILQLRERLAAPAPRRLAATEKRRAAVLVPLFVDADQLWTVLTRRAETLPQHKGQVAFPGGGLEVGEDAWAAALRESREELGLEQSTVVRIGELDEEATPCGFSIVPCVGAVPQGLEFEINRDEIDEVFSVPLLAFADVRVVEDREVRIDGVERMLRIYHVGRHQVWGLTARIIQNLLARLGVDTSAQDSLG